MKKYGRYYIVGAVLSISYGCTTSTICSTIYSTIYSTKQQNNLPTSAVSPTYQEYEQRTNGYYCSDNEEISLEPAQFIVEQEQNKKLVNLFDIAANSMACLNNVRSRFWYNDIKSFFWLSTPARMSDCVQVFEKKYVQLENELKELEQRGKCHVEKEYTLVEDLKRLLFVDQNGLKIDKKLQDNWVQELLQIFDSYDNLVGMHYLKITGSFVAIKIKRDQLLEYALRWIRKFTALDQKEKKVWVTALPDGRNRILNMARQVNFLSERIPVDILNIFTEEQSTREKYREAVEKTCIFSKEVFGSDSTIYLEVQKRLNRVKK